MSEPVPDGPAKGKTVGAENFEAMLDDYYANRGWDKDGNPTLEILETLGIGYAADNLKKRGLLGRPIPGGVPKVRGQRLKPKAM